MASRNLKDLEALDYELGEETPLSPHPSTRDGEYLQHSPTVWGHQYLSGKERSFLPHPPFPPCGGDNVHRLS